MVIVVMYLYPGKHSSTQHTGRQAQEKFSCEIFFLHDATRELINYYATNRINYEDQHNSGEIFNILIHTYTQNVQFAINIIFI